MSDVAAFAEDAGIPHKEAREKPQQSLPAGDRSSALKWSKLPLPSQKMLDDLLSRLKRIRFIDCVVDLQGEPFFQKGKNRKIEGLLFSENVVFDSSDPSVLKEVTEYLRIREGPSPEGGYPSAFYWAAPAIELTLDDGRVVYLGIFGDMLRWKKWRYEAILLNPKLFVNWLVEHKIPRRFEEAQAEYNKYEDEQAKAGFEELIRYAPKSQKIFFRSKIGPLFETLTPEYKKIYDDDETKLLKLAKSRLSRQFPSTSDQIGVLLEWDGKQTDRSKFRQGFPGRLLQEYDSKQVLWKIKNSSLTSAQWVGVSRYYSNYYFLQKFPSGYKPLDKALKKRIVRALRSTGKNSSDADAFEDAMRDWSPK